MDMYVHEDTRHITGNFQMKNGADPSTMIKL